TAAGEPPGWIGWHALGPFDSSGPAADAHLGWHFNPTDDDAAVRFADVHEYRETYYTPGLLKRLMETFELPPRRLPELPRLSLLFDRGEGRLLEPDNRDEYTLPALRQLKEVRIRAVGGASSVHFASVNTLVDVNGRPGTPQQARADGREWVVPEIPS